MNDPAKNVLIGLFVIAASAIVIFVLLFLHPTVGDDAQNIRVRFANIDKVSVGTRVTYGGKPVGEVIEIYDIEQPKDARKPGKDGFVYLYELVLGVDSKVHVYNTDQIVARTSGLLGEKSVEISPGPARPGEEVRLVTDQVIYANESGSVEETLKEFKQLADKIEETLDSFKFAIDELNRHKIWEKISKTAENLSDITTALNRPDQWKDTLDNVHTLSQRMNVTVDSILATFDEAQVVVKKIDKHIDTSLGPAFENLFTISDNVRAISHSINRGEGTLGQIIRRDDIYLRVTSLMSKAETILDDMNHYGLLYQNDKRWQRLRARRANLITRLECPQEFRNYFNDELDEITTGLSRLSMVLSEAENCDCYQAFMDDEEFRKVFAELLRRVTGMEESLKLYNTQIVERDNLKTELCSERD